MSFLIKLRTETENKYKQLNIQRYILLKLPIGPLGNR